MKTISQNAAKVKNVFCAIDLHEKSMLIGLAMDRGTPEFKELRTDEQGVFSLIEILGSIREANPGIHVHVAYEASGCGFRLADALIDHGFETAVLSPSNLPVTPRSRSNKTDKRDVIRILEVLRGHVLAGNNLPSVWIPPAQVRDDREIVRRRLALKERGADVKNSILGLLRRYGIARPESIKGNWSKKHIAWLHGLCGELAQGLSIHLQSLLLELGFYIEESARLDDEISRLSGEERYSRPCSALTMLKGVGVLTAMVFLTELGELARFKNRRSLACYIGLTPRSWESGEQSDRKGHISKLGPARVRKVLNQAAWSAVAHDPALKKWFRERTPGGKRRKKMIVAVMRMLAIRMWHAGLCVA